MARVGVHSRSHHVQNDLVLLVLMVLGVLPTWPHSRSWGYAPSSGLGLILIIVLVLFLLGVI